MPFWKYASFAVVAIALCGCGSSNPTPAEEEPLPVIETGGDAGQSEFDAAEPELGPEIAKPHFDGAVPLEDINPSPTIVEVEIEARVATVRLEDGLELEMYTFNGVVPGPLLQANVGDEVIVHFTNKLPEPTTIHWHGLRIPDEMDGNPRIQTPVQPGESFEYRFVVPDAGTYWYHPHMRANEQIEKGLYAPLVVHESPETQPEVAANRYIVLDDILLDGDEYAPFMRGHMEIMHGRWGNLLLANGSSEPFSFEATKGDVERWRVVNAANARTMEVTITGARFRVVGIDGGRVAPYETERLLLPVGRRFDLEVSYDQSGEATLEQIVLARNNAGQVVETNYSVGVVTVADSSASPAELDWAEPVAIPARTINREETVVLDAVEGGPYGVQWRINGESHNMEPLFTFERGDTVLLEVRNELGPEHPFHLHGQFFIDAQGAQAGLLDTILVPGFSKVKLVAFMDNPGEWMMHCHINEHAEAGMMSAIVVNE